MNPSKSGDQRMRLLFLIDKKDYDLNGTAFTYRSARCIHIKNGLAAMVHSVRYDYYVFPGGGIRENEGGKNALIRETQEETGLVVIPDSVREYGHVRQIQKSIREDADCFVSDSYYYLCDVEEKLQSQKLDGYEAEEGFTLEYVQPDRAIFINRHVNHGPKDPIPLEREAKVLELLKKEGYFTRS
ncbi:MAG: NUDIX domain-containing protein [Provencibacterium sp.]|jgi:8-oxo-dGTP pyrophosphatase MutT (NUDIX family)|nr:NUDIX domain-containing protein [Provencibacterium sp.]